MDITYIGHSCFLIKFDTGLTVCFDPYKEGSVPGLGPTDVEAHEVFCSHSHNDHNDFESVMSPAEPYTGREPEIDIIKTFHDDVQGAARGRNNITIVKVGGEKDGHMGDSGCDITKLVVEDGITGIGERSFARMKDLEEIELADSITEIGGAVFSDCNSKVKRVQLPASLETLGLYAFNLTGNIESFTIADRNPHFLTEDGVLYNKEKTILYYYPIAKKAESFTVPSSVLEIMPSAFNNAQNLKKAELPDGLGKIWYHAFSGCKNLAELTIPESVTVIGDYFLNGAGPDNTVSLYFDGKPAEIMERAFSNVNVTATVPAGMWTEGDMQQYGGNVKWVEK